MIPQRNGALLLRTTNEKGTTMQPLRVERIAGTMPHGESYYTFIVKWWRAIGENGHRDYGGTLYLHRDLGQKQPSVDDKLAAIGDPYGRGLTTGQVQASAGFIFVDFHVGHQHIMAGMKSNETAWMQQILAICRDDLQSRDMAEIESSSNQKGQA